jgi:hypothetical protein
VQAAFSHEDTRTAIAVEIALLVRSLTARGPGERLRLS